MVTYLVWTTDDEFSETQFVLAVDFFGHMAASLLPYFALLMLMVVSDAHVISTVVPSQPMAVLVFVAKR